YLRVEAGVVGDRRRRSGGDIVPPNRGEGVTDHDAGRVEPGAFEGLPSEERLESQGADLDWRTIGELVDPSLAVVAWTLGDPVRLEQQEAARTALGPGTVADGHGCGR